MKQTRIVTIIDERTPSGSFICELRGEGSRNYRVAIICADGSVNSEFLHEKRDWIKIIEGDHRELIRKLRVLAQETDEKQQQHGRDRETAIYEFRMQWDREHPTPSYPNLDDIISEYMQGKGA